MAVKVTEVPALEHVLVVEEIILTEGVTVGVIATEVVPAGLVQPLTVAVTL